MWPLLTSHGGADPARPSVGGTWRAGLFSGCCSNLPVNARVGSGSALAHGARGAFGSASPHASPVTRLCAVLHESAQLLIYRDLNLRLRIHVSLRVVQITPLDRRLRLWIARSGFLCLPSRSSRRLGARHPGRLRVTGSISPAAASAGELRAASPTQSAISIDRKLVCSA